ncbi:RNA-binding domain-containing protein [Deltaproteobacteria bacterium TL4]
MEKMDLTELKNLISCGEDSHHQFKEDIRNVDSLAAEMGAFANSDGGILFIGVSDKGGLTGLDAEGVARVNQLISNAASQHIRSPLAVQTQNILIENKRIVILLTIPEGMDKPYFDKNGVIWLKNGSDKRRVNSKEELRRIFQSVDLLHADDIPTKAGIEKLDQLRFRDFLQAFYKMNLPEDKEELLGLLQNMNLAVDSGVLNLAGVLLFAEHPEWIKPVFIVKAVTYPGTDIHVSEYIDSEDFVGPLKKIFDDSLAFIKRNLKRIQDGQNINSLGKLEISEVVFEELLVNALVHRDYMISATIRIFVFDNRVEIVSPGHLPNHLTVEKICAGNSNIRNPILVSFASKGLLPYRGLGSGIRRALEEWPNIDFFDDRDGCTFKSVIWRQKGNKPQKNAPLNDNFNLKVHDEQENAPLNAPLNDFQMKILSVIQKNTAISYEELSSTMGKDRSTIMRHIQTMKDKGFLIRVGSKKTGHWEILKI